jgi:hypothetical protein
MRYDRTVIAYHGCPAEVEERIHAGEIFKVSENAWDWLGRGVYFWEFGLDRAWGWAQEQGQRKGFTPAVVGAVIQLGECFDLLDTHATQYLAGYAKVYVQSLRSAGKDVPRNTGHEFGKRNFDCALLNSALHAVETVDGIRYQTVRCGFTEGERIYEDSEGIQSELRAHSHVQIVVRDLACIIGTFRPREINR